MKQYNRTTKKWETVNKKTTKGTLKKRDTCRGGKPHDFQMCLPDYIQKYAFHGEETPALVAQYYLIEEERYRTEKGFNERLIKLGISKSFCFNSSPTVYIKCTICGKKDYLK